MAETVVLDPVEVATGRTSLDITAWVRADAGIDWGDGAIESFMADRDRGSAPVDFRIPNRQIVIPLVVKQFGTTTFHQARLLLQGKVARIQQEGGWLKRVTSANTTVFADIVDATLHLGGGWLQAHRNVDLDAELRLVAIPDWYGPELQLADHVDNTGAGEVIWTETGVAGDYPGRVRLVVDNDSALNINGLLWGVRCRHYSNSTTAKLVYEAETCTPLDAASVIGGSVVAHPSLSSSWTPVLSTNQTGGVSLTHTGSYRVWVRCGGLKDPAPAPQIRLVWDVGDFALPTENAPVDMPSDGGYRILDLGTVRLDRVPAGTHRWQGVFQGRASSGGLPCTIDKFWLQPVDEGCGVLRAPPTLEPGLVGFGARDEFNQPSGALNGKTAASGGTWSGTGDTDDFVVNATPHELWRSAVSDASADSGRYAWIGAPSFSAVVVQADIWGGAQADRRTVLARFANANNYVRAGFRAGTSLVFEGKAGGVALSGATTSFSVGQASYTVRLYIDTVGNVMVWAFPAGGAAGDPLIVAQDPALASAGALASGFVGVYDAWTGSTPSTRSYDNVAAWVPSPDAVLFAGRSGEFRTEGMFRQDSTGQAYGPVSYVSGDLPRIPASGAEARTVQFFVKGTRSDLDSLPDPGNVATSARVTMRPSYLYVS